MTRRTSVIRFRVLVSILALTCSALATVTLVEPASAAGCSLPSGSDVNTKQWYLNQASSTVTVTWTVGQQVSASDFLSILQGGDKVWQAQYPPWGDAYFRTNGDYGLPVDLLDNACKGVLVVQVGANGHLWTNVCVAPEAGQIHTVCNWDLPEHLNGVMTFGYLDPATHRVGTSPTGSPVSTS